MSDMSSTIIVTGIVVITMKSLIAITLVCLLVG